MATQETIQRSNEQPCGEEKRIEKNRRGGRRRNQPQGDCSLPDGSRENRRPLTRRGMVRQQTGDADFQIQDLKAAAATPNCDGDSSEFDPSPWLSGGDGADAGTQ